jgi:hypothetical protein
MTFLDPVPCIPQVSTIDIVNAIFNGFQNLAIMVLAHYARKNGHGHAPPLPRRSTKVGP